MFVSQYLHAVHPVKLDLSHSAYGTVKREKELNLGVIKT